MKIIKVKVDIKWNEFTNSEVENINVIFDWQKYYLDNIPIFKNSLSLWDEISVRKDWKYLYLDKIIKKSWNKTIRLYFPETTLDIVKNNILENLKKIWCSFEWFKGYLFWINIPKDKNFENIINLLEKNIDYIFYEISDE